MRAPRVSLAAPLWKTANARTPGSLTGNQNQSCPKISVSKLFHLKASACSGDLYACPVLASSGKALSFRPPAERILVPGDREIMASGSAFQMLLGL